MPYPASIFERQRQLSTSLSTSTPSQSKMMRSGWVIAGFPSRSEHILKKWAITQAARGGDQLNLSEGPPDFMMISIRINFGRRPCMPAIRLVDFFYSDRRIRSGVPFLDRPVKEATKIFHKFVGRTGRCCTLVATCLDILGAKRCVRQRPCCFTKAVENASLVRLRQVIKTFKLFGFEILVDKPVEGLLARQRWRRRRLSSKDIQRLPVGSHKLRRDLAGLVLKGFANADLAPTRLSNVVTFVAFRIRIENAIFKAGVHHT